MNDIRKRLDEATKKLYPEDFPILMSKLGEQRARWVTGALQEINKGLEAGEIFNPRYNEAKESLNRAFSFAFDKMMNFDVANVYRRNQAGNPIPNDLEFLDLSNYDITLFKLPGIMKRIEKIKSHDPVVDLYVPFLREIAPLAEVMAYLKDKVVKRVPKTDEEKRQERFVPPPPSSEAVAQVQKVLEEIADRAYQELVKNFTDYNNSVYDGFIRVREDAKRDKSLNRPRRFHPAIVYDDDYSVYWHFTDKQTYMATSGRKGPMDSTSAGLIAGVERLPESQARVSLAKKAEEAAKEIRDSFVVKNLKKLASIIEAKGNFVSAAVVSEDVDLRGLTGTIRVAFADGSGFDAQNSVVFVVNSFNTRFYRYPLTFHNVKLPGGAKMPTPSEERMNTVFAAGGKG